MAAWYKEPDYNGGGVTKNKAFEPNIKKGYGDISKIAPIIAAGARLAAPALASVAAEGLKPISRQAGEKVAREGIDVPSPLGPKMHIGPKKQKMLKEDNIDVLIRQQQELAKAGRKFEAARLAEKIGQLRSRQFNTPKVQGEIATNKTWREGGQQNKFGHGGDYQKMEKEVIDASDKPTRASKNLIKRTLPASKGTVNTNKVKPWNTGMNPSHEEVNFNRRSELNKSLIKSIDSFLMRKGIIQKTANKSSLPLGDYQKAGKPIKRMVNSRAVDVSPDVWSAGKKTTITKI